MVSVRELVQKNKLFVAGGDPIIDDEKTCLGVEGEIWTPSEGSDSPVLIQLQFFLYNTNHSGPRINFYLPMVEAKSLVGNIPYEVLVDLYAGRGDTDLFLEVTTCMLLNEWIKSINFGIIKGVIRCAVVLSKDLVLHSEDMHEFARNFGLFDFFEPRDPKFSQKAMVRTSIF